MNDVDQYQYWMRYNEKYEQQTDKFKTSIVYTKNIATGHWVNVQNHSSSNRAIDDQLVDFALFFHEL